MVFTIGNLLVDLSTNSNSTIIDTIVNTTTGIYYVLITPNIFYSGNGNATTNIKAKENLFGSGFYLIGGGGGGAGAHSDNSGAGYCSNVADWEKQGSDGKANGGGGGGGSQLGVVFNDSTPTDNLFVTKGSYIQLTKGLGGAFGTGQGGGVNPEPACSGSGNYGYLSNINIESRTGQTILDAKGGNEGRLRTNKYTYAQGGIGGEPYYSISGAYPPTTRFKALRNGGNAGTESNTTPGNGFDIAYYDQLPTVLKDYITNNWTTLSITHAKPGMYPSGISGDRSSTSPNTGQGGAGAPGKNGGPKSASTAGGGGFYKQGGPTYGKYVTPSGTSGNKYMCGNNAPWKGLSQQTFAGEGGGGATAGMNGNNHEGGQGGSGSAFYWFTVKPPYTPNIISFLQSKPNRVLSHDESVSDPQNYSLTINTSSSPSNGTANFTSSTTVGHYTVDYTPNLNSLSADSFEFYAQNVAGLDSDTSTATIQAFTSYDQPTSSDASYIAIGDVSCNFNIEAQYDIDISGDIYDTSLSEAFLNIISGPSNGTITVDNTQTNLTNYTAIFSIIYHSPSPYVGPDSFTFTVEDASRAAITVNSGVSPQYTISLEVKDPAVTYDISGYVMEDITQSIDLSGSDINEYYPLKYFLDSYVSNGTLYDASDVPLNITDASYIGVQDTSNNNPPIIKYLGDLNFNGWDQFTFFVQDIHNYPSNIGSIPAGIVDISVSAVNDAPIAYDLTKTYFANNNTSVSSYNIDLSANDVDNPQSDLTYYIKSLPPSGTLIYNGTPVTSAPFTLTPMGSYDISYTPLSIFVGSTSFEYYVEDLEPLSSNTANVTIYLKPLTQNMSINTNESTPVDIGFNVTNSSTYHRDYQSVITNYPQYGSLYNKNNQELIVQGVYFDDIRCTYIPQNYYYGDDTFRYKVKYIQDGLSLESNESIVDISINFVNNKPVIPDQTFTFYVRKEPEVFDLSLVYYNYDGPDISDSIIVNTIPNFIKDNVITTEWSGYIYDNVTDPLKVGDTIENNNVPIFNQFNYFVDVKFAWPGNQYIGKSEFQIYAMDSSGGLMSDIATITVNFEYLALNGCDTGPGPDPEKLWTRDEGDCVDISGATLHGQPMTREDLSEKRKAVIFQYKNNSAGFSKKQQYSRLARGIGRQRGQTFATQSDTYTNANTKVLPLNNTVLECPGVAKNWAYTNQNDTPGPLTTITNEPSVPLTNYIVRRTYLAGNNKWPQLGWKPGMNGFPVGKMGKK